MAGEQYADLAVLKLHTWFESQLPTQLAAVETAQSLTAGDLTVPVDYIPAKVEDDNRSPLLQVYCDSTGEIEPEATGTDKIATYPCKVTVEYSGDADIEAGQLFMRRYLSALVKTLVASRTLNGTVVQALDSGHSTSAARTSESQTRYTIELGVDVTVHET